MATQTENVSKVGDSVQRWLKAYNDKQAALDNPALAAQDAFEADVQEYYDIEEFSKIQANARALLEIEAGTAVYDEIMATEFPIIKEFFVTNSATFDYFKFEDTLQQVSYDSGTDELVVTAI